MIEYFKLAMTDDIKTISERGENRFLKLENNFQFLLKSAGTRCKKKNSIDPCGFAFFPFSAVVSYILKIVARDTSTCVVRLLCNCTHTKLNPIPDNLLTTESDQVSLASLPVIHVQVEYTSRGLFFFLSLPGQLNVLTIRSS